MWGVILTVVFVILFSHTEMPIKNASKRQNYSDITRLLSEVFNCLQHIKAFS